MSMTQTQQQNVPALRFPEFSGEWVEERFEKSTISIKSGRSGYQESGEFPVYGSTGQIGFSGEFEFEQPAILVARVGANAGRINSAKGKYGVTDNTLAILLNKHTDFDFTVLLLEKTNLNRFVFGSGQPLITGTMLKRIKCTTPPFPEQQKIASFLSQVDRKIAQLGKKKALLHQYKKGIMQKLFSHELRFKDAQGNDFPDWEEKRLGDFYEFKSTNSLSRDKLNYEGGEVRNIHYGDIHTKFKPKFDLLQENVPFINTDVDLSRISNDKYCQVGDLVIADASEDYDDIGKAIELINLNGKKVLAGLHTLLARISSNEIYIGYGAFVMACATVRKQIKTIAQGTKVLGISVRRMEEIKLPMPSTEEQQKIADFLSSIDRKINLVTTELDHAKTFKKGLLQQMFI